RCLPDRKTLRDLARKGRVVRFERKPRALRDQCIAQATGVLQPLEGALAFGNAAGCEPGLRNQRREVRITSQFDARGKAVAAQRRTIGGVAMKSQEVLPSVARRK